MKIGIFARRERGERATAADWDTRNLPAPTARVAFAAIEPIDDFAPRWGGWAGRLGSDRPAPITDAGGRGGVDLERRARATARRDEVLDIYHAAEHIAAAGKGLFGEGTAGGDDGWRGAAGWCCPTAGPGCATTSARAGPGPRAVRARGVGRVDGLFRGPYRTDELRPSAAHGSVDRQRYGGGGGEEPDRQADEADRCAVGGRQRRGDGRPCAA